MAAGGPKSGAPHPTHPHDHDHDHDHAHGDHGHDHGHDHGNAGHGHRAGAKADAHAGHSHGPGGTHRYDNERRVLWAAVLTGAFMVAEVIGGIVSGSLALLADAGHMFGDTGSLVLAWVAFRLARRPADRHRTFGYDRAEILVAFANGLTMIGIALLIAWEAVDRFFTPVEVTWSTMLVIAGIGLAVNIVAFLVLHGGDRENLNMRGAALHVLGDLFGSVAAIAAALVIMVTGWMPIDPLLSLLVVLIIVRSAVAIIRDSAHILIEGTPAGLNPREIEADLVATVPGVTSIHHVHLWSISQERPMATMHACVSDETVTADVILEIKHRLHDRFRIDHATIEVEHGACADDVVAMQGAGVR